MVTLKQLMGRQLTQGEIGACRKSGATKILGVVIRYTSEEQEGQERFTKTYFFPRGRVESRIYNSEGLLEEKIVEYKIKNLHFSVTEYNPAGSFFGNTKRRTLK